MKVVYFTHSLASCWNHGNAHFLRGVLRELVHRGHEVTAYEPRGAWSLENLLKDHGEAALAAYSSLSPEVASAGFDLVIDLFDALRCAVVAIAHRWDDPWASAVNWDGGREGAAFTLLL